MCRRILQGAYKTFPQKGGKLWTEEMGNCCSYHPWGKEAQTPGLACTHMAPHQLSRNWVGCSQEMQKADMSLIFPYTFSIVQKLKLKLKILSEKLRQTPLKHKILSRGKSRGRFDSSTFPRTLNHPFHSWLLAVIKRHRQNASRISMQSIFFFLLFKNKLEKNNKKKKDMKSLMKHCSFCPMSDWSSWEFSAVSVMQDEECYHCCKHEQLLSEGSAAD